MRRESQAKASCTYKARSLIQSDTIKKYNYQEKEIKNTIIFIKMFFRNPGVRTIEEDLLKALFEAKYITEEDFNNQQNAQFQRSSRTDKGVSAARQVVSLKLRMYLISLYLYKLFVSM